MRRLCLKKIGPITEEATIEFDRFCVLIGPQSSGKSTIAKILSTCMWLEKEVCTTLDTNPLKQNLSFKDLIEDFHRIHGYIDESSSYIEYESDFLVIRFDKKLSIELKKSDDYRRNKILYVPSDRNVITMPDVEKRELSSTNFRSFLFDWLLCRKYFNKKHMADILDLGIKYYFDESLDKDFIMHKNGRSYNLPLYDSSSGCQSTVPLVLSLAFYTDTYFNVYDKEVSFQSKTNLDELLNKLLREFKLKDLLKKDSVHKKLAEDIKPIDDIKKQLKQFSLKLARLTKPFSSIFVIEEPEQNLFPNTQSDLITYIIKCCNRRHKSSAIVTTHSPYILTTLNNLIYAGIIREDLSKSGNQAKLDELNSIYHSDCQISPKELSVYAINEGSCRAIINQSTGLIDVNEIDMASEKLSSKFNALYCMHMGRG